MHDIWIYIYFLFSVSIPCRKRKWESIKNNTCRKVGMLDAETMWRPFQSWSMFCSSLFSGGYWIMKKVSMTGPWLMLFCGMSGSVRAHCRWWKHEGTNKSNGSDQGSCKARKGIDRSARRESTAEASQDLLPVGWFCQYVLGSECGRLWHDPVQHMFVHSIAAWYLFTVHPSLVSECF